MKETYDTNGLIPLTNLELKDFEKTITKLNDFWKAKSIAYLDKFGLPTLPAIAITNWNEEVKTELIQICKEKGWNSVVIRTDKKAETGERIPRGGYLTNLDQLSSEITKIFDMERIAMILEPRDRYRNLYGINILYEKTSPENLYFEVVGPGFEVSNLNRGDIMPHERIIIKRISDEPIILTHNTISLSDYKNSVFTRFVQIGRSIDQNQSTENMSDDELAKIAKNFLKKNKYDLLSQNETNYSSIPIDYINKIKNYVAELPYKMSKIGLDVEQFVLSATVFDSGELVFWDIVWPEHKYEGLKSG